MHIFFTPSKISIFRNTKNISHTKNSFFVCLFLEWPLQNIRFPSHFARKQEKTKTFLLMRFSFVLVNICENFKQRQTLCCIFRFAFFHCFSFLSLLKTLRTVTKCQKFNTEEKSPKIGKKSKINKNRCSSLKKLLWVECIERSVNDVNQWINERISLKWV